MNKLSQYNDVLTITDIMEIFQIGRNNAYKLVNSGVFRTLRIGKKIRVPKLALESYLYGSYDNNIGGIAINEGGNVIER